jgi:hypothetical protein
MSGGNQLELGSRNNSEMASHMEALLSVSITLGPEAAPASDLKQTESSAILRSLGELGLVLYVPVTQK